MVMPTMEMYCPSSKTKVQATIIRGEYVTSKGGSKRRVLYGEYNGKKCLPKTVKADVFAKYGFSAEESLVGTPSPPSPMDDAPALVPAPAEPSNESFSAESGDDDDCDVCGIIKTLNAEGYCSECSHKSEYFNALSEDSYIVTKSAEMDELADGVSAIRNRFGDSVGIVQVDDSDDDIEDVDVQIIDDGMDIVYEDTLGAESYSAEYNIKKSIEDVMVGQDLESNWEYQMTRAEYINDEYLEYLDSSPNPPMTRGEFRTQWLEAVREFHMYHEQKSFNADERIELQGDDGPSYTWANLYYNCPDCDEELSVVGGKGGTLAVCENGCETEYPRNMLENFDEWHWFHNHGAHENARNDYKEPKESGGIPVCGICDFSQSYSPDNMVEKDDGSWKCQGCGEITESFNAESFNALDMELDRNDCCELWVEKMYDNGRIGFGEANNLLASIEMDGLKCSSLGSSNCSKENMGAESQGLSKPARTAIGLTALGVGIALWKSEWINKLFEGK